VGLAGLAGLAVASGAACAQNVQLYGAVDTGLEYVTRANAAGNGVLRMPNVTGGLMASRWGLRGQEDLGNGLKASFALESGFGTDSGVQGQGGRLFGRQAWVALGSRLGQLTFGRQYNATLFAIGDSDVMGPAVYGLGSLDNYIPNTRSDNAIGYRGTYDNFTTVLTYSLGRDVSAAGGPAATNCPGERADDRKACRQVAGTLKYDTRQGGVAVGYDQFRGGPNVAGGLSDSDRTDTRHLLTAYVKFGQLKLGAGWIARTTRAAVKSDSDLYYLGASYPLTAAWTLDAEIARLRSSIDNGKSTLAAARATYAISKRTAVYGLAGFIDNNAGANLSVSGGQALSALPYGVNQAGVMAGMRHLF
jgi:predicted porin